MAEVRDFTQFAKIVPKSHHFMPCQTPLSIVRPLVLLAFALAWISCCIGCGVRPAPETPHRELAARLAAETVALVRLGADGRPHPFCAGVWVSPRAVVTAAHCVEHFAPASAADDLLEMLSVEHAPRSPLGREARFAMQGDLSRTGETLFWTGTVTGYDKADDLGLVTANEPAPEHVFARVSESALVAGDPVEVVGHPAGYAWSYAEGFLSAVRPDEPNADETPMSTLQIAAPISHGNSGGGAFDSSGALIGVCSYGDGNANGMGFFVGRDAVRRFLQSAGVL